MSTTSDNPTASGLSGTGGWLVGGILGGAVGAAAFGLLLWLFDPDIIGAAIPSIYGLDLTGIVGWAIHIAHGIVLGLLFGFLVTRESVLGILRTDVETEALSRSGDALRLVGAGFVFGLAVFAILPLLVLPVWAETMGGTAGEFPTSAIESLLGHLVFGTVLGIVFAAVTDLGDRSTGRPLEE